MANRYYSVLPNTPENKKILNITMALDAQRNVTGEPTYLWKVPLLTGENRIKAGKSYTPLTGGGFADMDEREPMRRPRGMVSSFIQPPNEYILSGTSASYPYYNADELKIVSARKIGGAYSRNPFVITEADKERAKQIGAFIENERNMNKQAKARANFIKNKTAEFDTRTIEGGGPLGAFASSSIKTGAKYGAKYGAQAVKTGIAVGKKGAQVAVMVAKNPAVQAIVSEIANDKDVQKAVVSQITSMVKGKAVENVVEDPPVEGGRMKKGTSDGRAKRAEIVKKVMREKGLKMIDASKYVKANNLY